MIIVAAGTGERYGADKLWEDVGGRPLLAHTIEAVSSSVDTCVVVCRHDRLRDVEDLRLNVESVPGGPSRTASEMAGLAVLGPGHALIGIHDGARPIVRADLVEALFERADEVGGAVPVLQPNGFYLSKSDGRPLEDVVAVQTPQVFRGRELHTAFTSAARDGVTGHDTLALVRRFSDLRISAVPGDPDNIKVTYPEDLKKVRDLIPG